MHSNPHILVVDDAPMMRELIVSILEELGYRRITQAGDGSQALAVLHEGNIDLVITDWNMPVMNGFALLKAVRASPALSHLPVLLATAEVDGYAMQAAQRAGADAYLCKPVAPERLAEALSAAFERRGGARQRE